MFNWLRDQLYHWLTREPPTTELIPCDFNRLRYEIRPCDVLLIEGRSYISHAIRAITQSTWTHAALYIGRVIDLDDETKNIILEHASYRDLKLKTRFIIEDNLGQGTILTKLSAYKQHHVRICRPIGITGPDAKLVIQYMARALGQPYNVRKLLDLARFLLPWTILPKRWGSRLFRTATGEPDGGFCSALIAEAFNEIQFPILPFMRPDATDKIEVIPRNPYLFTPKDFDYSPYFQIIKYPLFNVENPLPYYRRLPWAKDQNLFYQDNNIVSALWRHH